MAPGGRSSAGFAACCDKAETDMLARAMTAIAARDRVTRFDFALWDMDSHLVDGIVEITARVPRRRGRLSPSLIIGGPREDDRVASFGLPLIAPQAPCIVGLVVSEISRI